MHRHGQSVGTGFGFAGFDQRDLERIQIVKIPLALFNFFRIEALTGFKAYCPAYDDILNTVTTMILAHACAGVDVGSAAYAEGVNVALESLA